MRLTAALALLIAAACATAAAAAKPILNPGEALEVDQCLQSDNQQYSACLRKGGAIKVIKGPIGKNEEVIHTAGVKNGSGGHFTAKIVDGALVVIKTDKKQETIVWSSHTSLGSYLFLSDEGVLTLYQENILWDTSVWDTAGQAVSAATHITEPATGIQLPAIDSMSGTVPLRLLGLGVRSKAIAIASVKVYAVGLYVEAKAAQKALAKYQHVPPDQLSQSSDYYAELCKPGAFTRYLKLVFVRSVSTSKIVEALTAVKGVDEPAKEQLAKLLTDAIHTGGIHNKESIALGWEGKDRLVVLVRGNRAGEIQNGALAAAVFDMYLGADPVSPAAKKAWAHGLTSVF